MGSRGLREKRMDLTSPLGFTLIEVMVVLMIITALITMVLPRIGNQNNQLKETIRRFTVLAREIRHKARLENATYRLVIDMKGGVGDGASPHEYWVEKSASRVFLPSARKDPHKEERDKDGNIVDPYGFALDESILKEKKALPSSLWFEDVEIVGEERPVNSGKVFIHFFPEGLVQEAAIHFRVGQQGQWTFAINPLTGKSEIITKRVNLKEMRDQ